MIKYVEKFWIRGNHKPVTWNVHKAETVSTNNNSEGYNSKLGRKLGQHPNFYHLCGELKIELEKSKLDAMAAKTGNTNRNKNVNKKAQMFEKKRSDMREKLENGNVEMMIYQQTMGGMIKLPEVSAGEFEDETDVFNDFNDSECQIDEPIEVPRLEDIYVPLPDASVDEVSSILVHQAPAAPKNSNQVCVSDVEYRHINVSRKRLSELSYSIRGNNLRNKRRRLNDGEQVVFNSLDVNPLTDINLSANPSKLEVLDFFGVRQGDKLSLDQGEIIMDWRLEGS